MDNINIKQIEIEEASNFSYYYSIIESILFVSGEPLELKIIASLIECSHNKAKEILSSMSLNYEKSDRGIKLINNKGFYQLVTKPENGKFIQKMLGNNSKQTLSQSALETLAIIAYKQPITRALIDEIRGVKSDKAIASLVEKEIVKDCGRLEAPGKPILYGTTENFLKYFGLENLEEMPKLEELLLKYE